MSYTFVVILTIKRIDIYAVHEIVGIILGIIGEWDDVDIML